MKKFLLVVALVLCISIPSALAQSFNVKISSMPASKSSTVLLSRGETVTFDRSDPVGNYTIVWMYDGSILSCNDMAVPTRPTPLFQCSAVRDGQTEVSVVFYDTVGNKFQSNIITILVGRPELKIFAVSPQAVNGDVTVDVGGELKFGAVYPLGVADYGWKWGSNLSCTSMPSTSTEDKLLCKALSPGVTEMTFNAVDTSGRNRYLSNVIRVFVRAPVAGSSSGPILDSDLEVDDEEPETERQAAFNPRMLNIDPKLYRVRFNPSTKVIKFTADFEYYGQDGYAFQGTPRSSAIGVIECNFGMQDGKSQFSQSAKLFFEDQSSRASLPLNKGNALSLKGQLRMPQQYAHLLKRDWNRCSLRSTMGGETTLHYTLKRSGSVIQLSPFSGTTLDIFNEDVDPNPFNADKEKAYFHFRINKKADVTVRLNYGNGGLIKTLVAEQTLNTGSDHVIIWDGIDQYGGRVPEGTYTFAVNARSGTETDSFTGYFRLMRE